MKLFLLFLLPSLASATPTLAECGAEARRPRLDDIAVKCGTDSIILEVQICPVVYTGYNESELIMNYITNPACRATVDVTVSPPVARFKFPLTTMDACGSVFRYTSSAGTGIFSDFSNIQTVNISGIIRGVDPTTGAVTYNAELKYYYSCAYPLQYLVNNTQIDVSGSSISVKDRNGTFLSTLSMKLFNDSTYGTPMVMPKLGLELRTKVYVEVKAINLTGQYNVLLDRCYATISPLPANSSFFNLFVPCSMDSLTTMIVNGDNQSARFYFPAFRFIEQQNETVSSYYLHCITRLCEKSTCASFKQCNRRRRRSAEDGIDTNNIYTLTSPEILAKPNVAPNTQQPASYVATKQSSSSSVGLGITVGILASVCLIGIIVGAVFYKRLRN